MLHVCLSLTSYQQLRLKKGPRIESNLTDWISRGSKLLINYPIVSKKRNIRMLYSIPLGLIGASESPDSSYSIPLDK